MTEGKEEMQPITAAVRAAIEADGRKTLQIAKLAEIEPAMLYRFANGKTGITLKTLDRLAPVLGLSLQVEKPATVETLASIEDRIVERVAALLGARASAPSVKATQAQEWPEGEAFEPAKGARILGRTGQLTLDPKPRQRAKPPIEIKRETCRLIREEGYTAAAAGMKTGVRPGSINAWLKLYDAGTL